MLTAYLDESGHEIKDAVIVAGFLGDDERWKRCEEKWCAALGPHRAGLHMKDLRWKTDRTRKLLERLGPIPHECGLVALLAMLRVSDYYDLVSGTPAEKMTKGYYFCLITLLDALVKNTPNNQAVKLILEEQNEYKTRASYLFQANKHHLTITGEPKFSSIEFIPKNSSVLTQPADYLAFAKLQQHRDPQSRKSRLCAPIMHNTQPAFGMIHDGKGLREVLKRTLQKLPEFAKRTEVNSTQI
jgi:Protein of unknown function (DUF3800)